MRWAASDVSPSSHLAFHIPTLAGFCLLFVLCCCLVLTRLDRSLGYAAKKKWIEPLLALTLTTLQHFRQLKTQKALHARRWQTKEGTYRIKRRALPDVRDEPLQDENAAASCSDGKPRWRCWDGDYAMGFQHHT